jgi:hypothetical protein
MIYDIFDVTLMKATGASGYEVPVDCVAFKTVDSATYRDGFDAMNYPIYSPYGNETVSTSYENWIRLKFTLKEEYKDCLYPSGVYIREIDPCTKEPTITKFTTISNIKVWLNFVNMPGYSIFYGLTPTYVKPVKTISTVATTDLSTFEMSEFDGTDLPPVLVNGQSSVSLNDLLAGETEYIVFQLQLRKGFDYMNNHQVIKFKINYDVR